MESQKERHDGSEVAPRRADALRSRERILRAAGPLFERDPQATMSQVAAAADVGRSTLHRHFPRRRDLHRAVAELDAHRAGSTESHAAAAGGGSSPGELQPAGRLGRVESLALEALHVLDAIPPHLVPGQLVAEAQRIAGVQLALYMVDVHGFGLVRLAGYEALPARLELPIGLGREIAPDSLEDLYAHLAAELPGCVAVPLWLRGRATGILLAVGTPRRPLDEVARQGAAALELASRHTDTIEAVRREGTTNPAAEMQLNLLPAASIMAVSGGEIAGGVLPSVAVGGDWYDFSDNRDGTWLAIADAAGEGPVAAGRAAVSLGALRSARRRGLGLEDSALVVHQLVHDLDDDNFWVSAVLAHWQAPTRTFRWISLGHTPPLLVHRDGTSEELENDEELALGRAARTREFRPRSRRLEPGQRVVLFSNGVLGRGTSAGPLGLAGVQAAAVATKGISAAATARSIQHAVVEASGLPLEDDATVLVLAVA